ncbi:hypothetical protein CRW07_00290 [Salmonella enterica]|nr:hypothetical protein [Salmonella enterica]EBD3754060.1 hypothetical protein [Salmonella enterica]
MNQLTTSLAINILAMYLLGYANLSTFTLMMAAAMCSMNELVCSTSLLGGRMTVVSSKKLRKTQ